MKTFIPALIVQSAHAWNYVGNGADWGTNAVATDANNEYQFCGTGSQSPIDLKKSWPTKSDKFTITTYEWPAATRTFGKFTIKYQANPKGGAAGAED